jgi:hypothetical protein
MFVPQATSGCSGSDFVLKTYGMSLSDTRDPEPKLEEDIAEAKAEVNKIRDTIVASVIAQYDDILRTLPKGHKATRYATEGVENVLFQVIHADVVALYRQRVCHLSSIFIYIDSFLVGF